MTEYFVKLTKEFKLSLIALFKLFKPLYEISDSRLNLHEMFSSHHAQDFAVTPSCSDFFLFLKTLERKGKSETNAYISDTTRAIDADFENRAGATSSSF